MKKCVTLALVIMLVAIVAVLLPGCGADAKPDAKQYMQQGDKLTRQFKEAANTWLKNIKPALGSPSGMEKFRASASDMSKAAEEAKAVYEKIGSLKGVEDYAKYADLEIQRLDIFQEFITLTNTYFDQAVAMMDSGDVTNLQSLNDKYTEDAGKLGEKIDGMDQEAQKLKADKNL